MYYLLQRILHQRICKLCIRFLFVSISLTAAISGSIHSSQAATGLSHFELSPEQLFDAKVISASKTSEKLRDAPTAIFVLTNEDIKRSGATSIPEVLRLVPGVQVARINSHSWAVSVRGFNSDLANKLLVLVDGREVYDHLYSGVYWNTQDTVLEDIDRIEVIRGPGATLWGANAVNGVINIISKKASETQGTEVTALAGNEDRFIGTSRYGGKFGDKGYYRVYGKYADRDEQHPLTGNHAIDDWQDGRGGFRADWGGDNDINTYTLQGDVYANYTDQYRSVPLLSPPYSLTYEDSLITRGGNILGRWNKQLSSDSRLSVQSYLDYTFHDVELLEDERIAFDLEAEYELPAIKNHKIIVGAKTHYISEQLTKSPEIDFLEDYLSDYRLSGFIQDKITLVPESWFLTIGSKFGYNNLSGSEIQPNARLQWNINDRQMLWGSVARAIRTPNPLEQNMNISLATVPPSPALFPVPISVVLQANQGFESEELVAYELGYRHQLTSKLLVDVATFYNDYDKLATNSIMPGSIVNNGVDPTYLSLPILITNDTEAKTYGFEAIINWRALENLNLSTSYSFIELELEGPPSTAAINAEVDEGRVPHNQFNFRSLWNVNNNNALDATVYYVDSISALQIKDYWRLDLRWGWHINKQLEFDLVGQNLLSDAHQEFSVFTNGNSNEIQRSVYGKFTWHF